MNELLLSNLSIERCSPEDKVCIFVPIPLPAEHVTEHRGGTRFVLAGESVGPLIKLAKVNSLFIQ